jgi:hypothetical protein
VAIAAKLDDRDVLAQVEAVDRFTANMIAYPGRAARTTTWRVLDEWIDRHSGGQASRADRPTPIGTARRRRHPSAASRGQAAARR